MATLGTLIKKINNTYGVSVGGNYKDNYFIKGIKFLTKDNIKSTQSTANTLFLADYSLFDSANNYNTCLFVSTHKDLDNKKCLYIKEDINLFDLFNQLYSILDDNEKLEEEKKSLFFSLYKDKTLNEILTIATSALNYPIILLDSSYSIIAKDKDYDSSIVFEKRGNRFSLKQEFIDKMKTESINEKLYTSTLPFTALIRPINKYATFESIRIAHSVVGYLFIRTGDKKASSEELEYIHLLSQIISIQMQKDSSYHHPFSLQNDVFFKDLFLGHFKSPQEVNTSLEKLFVNSKSSYFFVSCGFKNSDPKIMSPYYYWLGLDQVFDNSITSIQEDYFLTLISTDDYDKYISLVKSRFENFLIMNKMQAAISYRFSNILEAKYYANQATSQLKHNMVKNNEAPITFYKHFFFDYLIYSAINLKEIETSIHPTIREMIKYDKENKTEYVKTLITYLDNNRDAPKTAQALFLHKSTLFYRFDKMTKLFLLKLEDADSLFAYEFSLRVLKVLKE